MIISIDKEHIYNLFGVTDFISLEMAIDIMAPSLLHYHFSDFFKYGEEILFFNKREIENSFYLGKNTDQIFSTYHFENLDSKSPFSSGSWAAESYLTSIVWH